MSISEPIASVLTMPSAGDPAPAADGNTRIQLRADYVPGEPFGGWWPRSRSLAEELPAVIRALMVRGYDIRRVTYNMAAWDQNPPRKLVVDGRLVRLSGFRTQAADSIVLIDTTAWDTGTFPRLEVLVIPPTESGPTAERAVELAGRTGQRWTASDTMQ
ncbi:DUF5994 family protein [Jatrophihabitans telluris]|uniref:DUF5994 family protein n=1 Tax=Jatrophihabitans telluris TaxID=2038343 RepID=A0ABY4QUK1_9ACTN|nr:DUF5994 family protein [Jatrophihabitans telluris]UQX87304.1 DUF5994 family protein [Jatrophihabitans telluris]